MPEYKVTIGKTTDTATLGKSDVIGAGGEAVVYKYKGHAIKIWHDYDVGKIKKVKAILGIEWGDDLPSQVVTPISPVLDRSDRIVGFCMNLLPDGYNQLVYMFKKRFVELHKISMSDRIGIFVSMHKVLKNLHKLGVVVGDLNDRNETFCVGGDPNIVFLDVDSFQYKQHSCVVGTEAYIDPRLYGLNLDSGVFYDCESDWYSYTTMLFRALVRAHPYGGAHNTVAGIPNRACANIFVADNSVTYPSNALPLGVLSDDILDIFSQFYTNNVRKEFPLSTLIRYGESVVACHSCGIEYFSHRGSCPSCSVRVPVVQLHREVTIDNMVIKQIIQSDGNILAYVPLDYTHTCLCVENGVVVRRHNRVHSGSATKPIYAFDPDYEVDLINENMMCVSSNGKVSVVSISDLDKVIEVDADSYGGGISAVCTRNKLWRVHNDELLSVEFTTMYGKTVSEQKKITNVMSGQTWLCGDFVSDHVGGFMRILNIYRWFCVHKGGTYNLNLQKVQGNFSLLDQHMYFGKKGVLVIRVVKFANSLSQQILVDYCSYVGDLIAPFIRQYSIDGLWSRVRGKVFQEVGDKIIVLHPTDKGITQEVLCTGATKVFTGTVSFVDCGSTLRMHNNNIIAVTGDSVYSIGATR